MIGRIRNSWTYRSAALYRAFVRWRPIPVAPKPAQDLLYLTLGAANHLEMMETSIRSLGATWTRLPRVRIVLADETSPRDVELRFSFWPGPVEVRSWRNVAKWAAEAIGTDLARFAEREPMGRKMAAVLQAASQGETLYSDVDVLWFSEPPSLSSWTLRQAPFLAMSSDIVAAYDSRIVARWAPGLSSPPHFCAGVMYVHGVPSISDSDREILSLSAESGIGLSEQTLFAKWNRAAGDHCFSETEIFLSDADRLSSGPTNVGKSWAARHYVGQVRHHLWRDAAFLSRSERRRASS